MLPPPPGLFSTTMVHLVAADSFSATSLARVSVPPPGENGTMSRIGFSGHFACANAIGASEAREPALTAFRNSRRFKVRSSIDDCRLRSMRLRRGNEALGHTRIGHMAVEGFAGQC